MVFQDLSVTGNINLNSDICQKILFEVSKMGPFAEMQNIH